MPDGQWLEYYYNQGQLLGMTLDHQPLAAFRWDKQGRECERRQGNGLVNRYQYDPLGQLIAHQRYHGYDISTQTSPTPIWQQQYHYNPNGQLAEITGHQPRRYRYDNAGQLHTVTYPEVNPEQHHAEKVEQFDYDPTGNKISETQALAPTPFHANIAKGNRLTFFSDKHFEYDRFGNLIAEKRGKNHSLVTHYEYDCQHRLIKVIKPTGLIITYTYNAFNRRTSKTVDGKTTEFIWQGSKLIAETDNDKHWQSYLYEPGSYRPLALVHGNAQQDNIKLYWYQNDHPGTPIALTGSLGDTLYECQYNAYGQIINETYHQDDIDSLPDNPLRFQGQYYDEETGLHYNLNRYYDPFTGRYITQDPLGILGGLNSYQYVNADPINWIDPLGLIKVENNGFEGVSSKISPENEKYVDILSPEAKQHILYGDGPTSGGHMYPGNPGKTTFPKDWSADKIVHEIGDIATAPNTQWYAQTGTGSIYTKSGKPARWVAYEIRDEVRIRVIYQPANGRVITAFPDNAPTPKNYKKVGK